MQHKFRRTTEIVVSATAAAIMVVVRASYGRFNPKSASHRYALRTAAWKAALRGPCAAKVGSSQMCASPARRSTRLWLALASTGSTIHLPTTPARWREVESGFAQKCGFPGVVGALDGTLIRIQHLADFEGFYCRKRYPAFNIQAIVAHEQRFVSYSIRNGTSLY
ncbi:hypothetical protein JG687_00003124 [Phytophthora cactorum]|uniref:DDE Tnp4 domain-containing protein n=1 Tax=Phytophthora cactorum TaxID=29920 RepID=A0A8T1UVD7_9STRA|nr:hypothetical protein JG687_00003124 [Phytophthora cactorum]